MHTQAPPLPEQFRQWIEDQVELAGGSQAAAARALGLDRAELGRIAKGERGERVTLAMLGRIREATGRPGWTILRELEEGAPAEPDRGLGAEWLRLRETIDRSDLPDETIRATLACLAALTTADLLRCVVEIACIVLEHGPSAEAMAAVVARLERERVEQPETAARRRRRRRLWESVRPVCR